MGYKLKKIANFSSGKKLILKGGGGNNRIAQYVSLNLFILPYIDFNKNALPYLARELLYSLILLIVSRQGWDLCTKKVTREI